MARVQATRLANEKSQDRHGSRMKQLIRLATVGGYKPSVNQPSQTLFWMLKKQVHF